MSSDSSTSDDDESSTFDEVKYRPFAHLQPAKVEFTSIFPAYPKSHINGYATVVDLDKSITKVDDVTKLRNALQYSLTKGHGQRYKTVEFFGIDGDEDIQMNYHHRICAGVKVCEFLPDKMKQSHTEVDELEGHEWAKLLAKQEQAEATSFTSELLEDYEEYKDYKCIKEDVFGKSCGGTTIIGSFKSKPSFNTYNRLFIGCANYPKIRRPGQKHTCFPLKGHDPVAVLQLWGKAKCFVHDDILADLGINWENDELSIYPY